MAMLWVDKHRPKAFDEMDYHSDLSARLKKIAASRDQPHMLIAGPGGAGKSTRVHALLRELYGPGADLVKVETRSVAPNPNSPNNTVDIQVLVSNYHLAVTPSDIGNKDHAVVVQLIKEVAAHPPLGGHTFKVVVIDEAGSLSATAQAALRRTMERYMKTCRIILTCDSTSKIIPPLRSRCLSIRVAAPSQQEVQKVLIKVADAEGVKCAPELAQKIAENTGRDLRRALLVLETIHTQTNTKVLAGTVAIPPEAWDQAIERVAKKILQEQSPRMAMEVRGNVYELMAGCLPPDFILKELLAKLLKEARGGDNLQRQAIAAAAHFESTMKQGSKDIFHLEAFVLRFMADYKAALAPGSSVGASQR
jgi:replication factor C subunit 3/5